MRHGTGAGRIVRRERRRRRTTTRGTAAIVAAAGLALGCWMAPPAAAEDLAAGQSNLIRQVLPTVVNISVRKPEEQPDDAQGGMVQAPVPSANTVVKDYVGSGFVIESSGLIVTNYHVVENAYEIVVTFSDGSRLSGRTLSASRLADLALVKVQPDHALSAAHWGDSDRLQVGDQVFAAGNPFGIGLSVSAGIVSGLNRDIQNSPYDDLIQTDATINHGNSGGPLFDMQGNVVGVDSAIISPTAGSAGLGFAVPSSTARFVVNQLLTYGWVHPAWIGVKLQQVTPPIAAGIGLPRPAGSIVDWVLPNSPAQRAGLAIGDVILRFDNKAPTDERALLRSLAHTPVGETVNLLVRRDGQDRSVPVTVAEWPRNQWDQRDAPLSVTPPKVVIPPDLGLSLSPVPAVTRAAMGLGNGLDGVLVTGVTPNSDPMRRGVTNGDIILRVGDKTVAAPAEVQAGIDAARAQKRDFVVMLVLPRKHVTPGPTWVALAVGPAGA